MGDADFQQAVKELLSLDETHSDWQKSFEAGVVKYQSIRDQAERTLLHAFARKGNVAQVKIVLQFIALNVETTWGITPLLDAMDNLEHPEVLSLLLEKDQDHSQVKQVLAMIININDGVVRLLDVLCQKISRSLQQFDHLVDILDDLFVLCSEKNCDHVPCQLFRIIVERCKDVRDFIGCTLLHRFVMKNVDRDVEKKIKILLQYISPDVVDQLQETPLVAAVRNNNVCGVQLLIQAGADVRRLYAPIPPRGYNVFHIAVGKDWRIMKLLLEVVSHGNAEFNNQPHPIEQEDLGKKTPVNLAVEYDDIFSMILFELYGYYSYLPVDFCKTRWHTLRRSAVIDDFRKQLSASECCEDIRPQVAAWEKSSGSFWDSKDKKDKTDKEKNEKPKGFFGVLVSLVSHY